MTPRFSLRALLVVSTIVCVASYWMYRSGAVANRFVTAIERGEFAAADAMFNNPSDRFAVEFSQRDPRNRIVATRERQRWSDWLSGECRIVIELDDWSGWGGYTIGAAVEVTPQGLRRVAVTRQASEDRRILGDPSR